MTDSAAWPTAQWRDVEQRLRPFVARRVASAADVDDVVQEVLARVARGVSTLDDDARFGSWLFAIARNAIVDQQRDRVRHPPAGGDTPEAVAPEEESDAGLEKEMIACVARFVALLPDEYREAITLVELEGVSQKDAAAMLGISHSGMKSRVQRGRAALRQMFEKACALELDPRRRVIECEPKGQPCGGRQRS